MRPVLSINHCANRASTWPRPSGPSRSQDGCAFASCATIPGISDGSVQFTRPTTCPFAGLRTSWEVSLGVLTRFSDVVVIGRV
ncbi:Uncharacterised protein [Mycobacteroides abscessus subsp. abscessus]|nr:Uncharacterised protein [Mycobacteroides abscessus subsp. abscessus]